MLTVYSASAGSGKTYNLVLDYLSVCFKSQLPAFLALDDRRRYVCPSCNGYKHTLAITFTNNAGAEMKERVVMMLNNLAFANTVDDLGKSDFSNLCSKVFGPKTKLSAEDCFIFLHENAKTLLSSILYDYARFSITTIDSFIQRIIRSSALLLNLSMSYAVQIRLNDFFRMAIEQYICELPKDKQQFDVVVKELARQMEDNGSANIHRFLTQGLRILYYDTEKSHPYLPKFIDTSVLQPIIANWRTMPYSILEQCRKKVHPLAKQACDLIASAKNDGLEMNGQKKWDIWFSRIADDPFNLDKGYDKSRILAEMDESSVFKKGKASMEDFRTLCAVQLKNLFEQIRTIVTGMAKPYFTSLILSKNANHLLVLNSLQNHIENIKEQTDSFFLSESNPLMYDAIESGQGDPLFEKMGFYRNVFIDEFQDTSKMQWYDMKPLIINALSGDGDYNGNIILFGDVKQSIYRFRNGDAELFYNLSDSNRLVQTASERDLVQIVGDNYRFIPLKTNYRSQSSIIEFNNAFFKVFSADLCKTDYYADVEQETREEKSGGLVQILSCNKQEYREIKTVWPECPDDFCQNVYRQLRPEEADLLYAVMDAKRRGYAYKDMAVLLSGRAKCNTFAQCLMQADIPVLTSESLQLCDNKSVNLIISTLRLLLNPFDILMQTVILHYFSVETAQDFNSILFANSSEGFAAAMAKHFGKTDFQKTMENWVRNPFLVTLMDIVRFYSFSPDNDPFIADFIDLAVEYSQSQVASVAGFLSWWDDLNQYQDTIPRLSLSGSSDAVRLMTIHASKGLQFPVVITQCTASTARESFYWVKDTQSGQYCYVKHEKNMQYSDFQAEYEAEEDKRALDALNLCYVDFTRAVDMLYILVEFPDSSKGDGERMNVKKVLQKFVNANNSENNAPVSMSEEAGGLYYYGDKEWVNPKIMTEDADGKEDFRIDYSDWTLMDNQNIQVKSSEPESDSAEEGTTVHRFLQKLTQFPNNNTEKDAILAECPEGIRGRMERLFVKTADDPGLRPYFYLNENDRVFNEAPVITEKGEIRRPDRIVFKPDHVMIIDYKTGREYTDKYEEQLAQYGECLRKMGYVDVRTKILYIDE